MSAPETLEPIAERANTLFEARIKPQLGSINPNDFLAIDINSGDYETGPEDLPTCDNLRWRRPDARVYLRRVGDDAAYENISVTVLEGEEGE